MKTLELVEQTADLLLGGMKKLAARINALEERADTTGAVPKDVSTRLELLEVKLAAMQAQVAEMVHKGVYYPGGAYKRGNYVTFNGSTWVAKEDTTEPPESESRVWQLTAKRGRDGKDIDRGGRQ